MAINIKSLQAFLIAQNCSRQLIFYLLIGIFFAGFYIIVAMILMDWIMLPSWSASMLAYLLLITPAYLSQKLFAFQSKSKVSITFPRYIFLQFITLILASITAHLLKNVMDFPTFLISCLSASVAILFNFFLLKKWVFAYK